MTLPAPGDSFQRFQVLEEIGAGGMGAVYRARDTRLNRDVALKFLTAAEPDSPQQYQRFQREARTLASLRHPNIVTIHDFDELDGTPFLVLEWVAGRSLAERLHVPESSLEEFFRLSVPIAEALGAAHRQGVVHRDLKPANVLLSRDGEVKLADFGLAKLRGDDRSLTRVGALLGTVAYMSPEQARSGEVGPPTDIFAFGVLAYELLAGEHPFPGERPASVLYRIANEEPSPLERLRPGLPSGLLLLLRRCLRKAPEERPADGAELAAELRLLSAGSGEAARAFSSARTIEQPTPSPQQEIRFCTTRDDVDIAYALIGQGPPLVRVLGWFTHLEIEWEWPELRFLWELLAEHFTVVRYDGRGIGLSDRWTGEFTEETRRLDLEAVLDAARLDSAALLAISEGGWTAASFAVESADRVSHLIFYGCYSRGVTARPEYDPEEDKALMTLMRKGWGRKDPTFRQVFTSQFYPPDADPELIAHFNELQRASADAETAVRYLQSLHLGRGDGREIFERIRTPTLVLHQRHERTFSFEEGRRIAALVPGARFQPLSGTDHYFPIDRSSATRVAEAIVRFVKESGERSGPRPPKTVL